MTEPAKAATVYREVTSETPPTHFRSAIVTWDGWPDDVREIVRRWNSDRRLRFVYLGSPFVCPDCRRRIDSGNSTACRLHGLFVCDDCVIDRARRFGYRGRPETELEKARRWCRNLNTRIARYRHNAIQERLHVAHLLTRIDALAEGARTSLLDEQIGVVDAVAEAARALNEIREAARPYIEKAGRLPQ